MSVAARILLFLAAIAMTGPAYAQAPAAAVPPPSGPLYVVTYFEVAPPTAGRTVGLLRQFAAATRKEAGNLGFLPLHEIGRPGRFAVVEAWRDKAASDAHAGAMKAFGDKLQSAFTAPFDPRSFWGLSIAPPANGENGSGIYVLTHVDVFPAGKDQVAAMVKQLAEDSRKEEGALRFNALVQDAHPNHFHLVEEWAGRGAREAHVLAEPTRQFRAKLVPFEGALYDERLYEAVR